MNLEKLSDEELEKQGYYRSMDKQGNIKIIPKMLKPTRQLLKQNITTILDRQRYKNHMRKT